MSATRYGYCCRPKLRGYVERVCFDSVRLWFSLEEDAVHNATSSNPRQIYELLRHIVEQGDPGHRYLRDLRRELSAVARLSRRPPSIRRRLRQQIEDAPLESFRPERMRLDLGWIAGQRGCTVDKLLADCRDRAAESIALPQWLQVDEFLVGGLSLAEQGAWGKFF